MQQRRFSIHPLYGLRHPKMALLCSALLLLSLVFPLIGTAAQADAPLTVQLATSNFGVQFLHADADNLTDATHATFTLTNGSSLWYGIKVSSSPGGLKAIAANPYDDFLSAQLSTLGLLQPADVLPLNVDGTFFQSLHLAVSFSAPNQQVTLTLNPLDFKAATLNVLGLVLDYLGLSNNQAQIGLLAVGAVPKIVALVEGSGAFIKLVSDFIAAMSAVPDGDVQGHMLACFDDLLRIVGDSGLRQTLAQTLILMVGKALPGAAILPILASFPLKYFSLFKNFGDTLLAFGSFAFNKDQLPTVTVRSVAADQANATSTIPATDTLTSTDTDTPIPTATDTPAVNDTPVPTDTPVPPPPTSTPAGPNFIVIPAKQITEGGFDTLILDSDCTEDPTFTYYICTVTIYDNYASVDWSASSPDPGDTFNPQGGTLTPGNNIDVTVQIPETECSTYAYFGSALTFSASDGESGTVQVNCA